MIYRLFGAVLIFSSCCGIGYRILERRKQTIQMLQQLGRFIDAILYSLPYHRYPLVQLLRSEFNLFSGELYSFFQRLIGELDKQIAPNVACCVIAAMSGHNTLPEEVKAILTELGDSFGRFDLEGQLKYLEGTRCICKNALAPLEDNYQGYARCCRAYSATIGVILALFLI